MARACHGESCSQQGRDSETKRERDRPEPQHPVRSPPGELRASRQAPPCQCSQLRSKPLKHGPFGDSAGPNWSNLYAIFLNGEKSPSRFATVSSCHCFPYDVWHQGITSLHPQMVRWLMCNQRQLSVHTVSSRRFGPGLPLGPSG